MTYLIYTLTNSMLAPLCATQESVPAEVEQSWFQGACRAVLLLCEPHGSSIVNLKAACNW